MKQALAKGAVAAVVSRDLEDIVETDKLFFVANTDEALEDYNTYLEKGILIFLPIYTYDMVYNNRALLWKKKSKYELLVKFH